MRPIGLRRCIPAGLTHFFLFSTKIFRSWIVGNAGAGEPLHMITFPRYPLKWSLGWKFPSGQLRAGTSGQTL